MSLVCTRLPSSRVRAPQRDRSAVVVPHGDAARNALRDNAIQQMSLAWTLASEDYQRLRKATREYLLARASAYVQQYLPTARSVNDTEALVVMTGHQPELFHPGVWFKNFLASELARKTSAVAIHLIVDNDLCRSSAIRVPSGSIDEPRFDLIPMDASSVPVPFEERRVDDRSQWDSFGGRVASAVSPFLSDPLIGAIWPTAMGAASRHGNVGRALSESRHHFEHQCGLETLELPFSQLCETPGYLHFVAHILEQLPRFHAVFHRELQVHRRAFRIRSQTHPVPILGRRDDWWEAPFWIWSSAHPRRQPLWIRRSGEAMEVRVSIPIPGPGPVEEFHHALADDSLRLAPSRPLVFGLQQLALQGLKIRPRALTLTMFARMFLCDLFIHGIGGARYDCFTDQLIQAFFQVSPPEFITASATYYLPIADAADDPDRIRQFDGELRELKYHPERYLGELGHTSASTSRLVHQKREMVAIPPPRGERKAWHWAINQINRQLGDAVQPVRERLLEQRQQALVKQRKGEVLGSREYPFCLFPSEELPASLLDMARRMA